MEKESATPTSFPETQLSEREPRLILNIWISDDPIIDNEEKADAFWGRVASYYNENRPRVLQKEIPCVRRPPPPNSSLGRAPSHAPPQAHHWSTYARPRASNYNNLQTLALVCAAHLLPTPLSVVPLLTRRRRLPHATALLHRTCSDHCNEEIPFVSNSSVLLVQTNEGFVLPVVDLIDDLPPLTV
ncbi:hypothetical protein F511_14723 [Dorcoceras hygrometricum]|uniref:Uncharacterized protein n=1 Tax=Dorcoceras hygrometricum TaxID=472368 RepID=A0A2Z7AVC3_9LAMI|nr:hypothetical protein F511_14723 [Dorcoceras hygrometricum]